MIVNSYRFSKQQLLVDIAKASIILILILLMHGMYVCIMHFKAPFPGSVFLVVFATLVPGAPSDSRSLCKSPVCDTFPLHIIDVRLG